MMSVAKSYEKYEIIGEPYEHDKRQYVKIKYPCCRKSSCSKCSGEGYYLKEVRWYDEPIIFDGRKGFGFFEAGYITLIDGPEDILEYHFRNIAPRQARYNLLFHWYIPSSLELPVLPQNCRFIRLNWEQISENDKIYDYDKVSRIVKSLVIGVPTSSSAYVGKVGDRIELDLMVIADSINQGYYGDTHTFIFEDDKSNRYAWKTSARKLEVGEIYHLKGTIKEHLKLEDIEHTILTRCREG